MAVLWVNNMQLNVKAKNIPMVIGALKLNNIRVSNAAEKGIKEAGFFIESEVVQSIAGHRAEPRSVDTSLFMNTVNTTFPKKLSAKVKSGVDYSEQLEFGTSKMNARHHFGNTEKRNAKKVKEFIQNKINKAI